MNPVQFKVSPINSKKMNNLKGMTVFNTEECDTKKQPMFFGKPLGVQRYDEFKYPVFDKLTQQQLGYFWRPEEVSLQKDRADYARLTSEQKHIFTVTSSIRSSWTLYKVVVLAWLSSHTVHYLNLNHV